jgi:hypothetical protein
MRRSKAAILTIGATAVILAVVMAVGAARYLESQTWPHHNLAATKRPWGAAEIVGTWQYPSEYPRGVVMITFNPDGTFQQIVPTPGSTRSMSQAGHWAIERKSGVKNSGFVGGQVNVYGALMFKDNKWVPDEWTWWKVVDSKRRPGEMTIFGGTFPDPDVYDEFTRVRNTTAPPSFHFPTE